MKRLAFLAVAVLLVTASGARAGNISGCSTSNKCQFVPTSGGTDYFCDLTCSGGSCSSATSDICPGHCYDKPWKECVSDSPCGSGDYCEGSGSGGTCNSTSPHPGALCRDDVDCCQSDGSCPCSGSGSCCDLGQSQAFLGDGRLTTCGSGSADTITGTSGNDLICGKGGNDTIDGGSGADSIDGGGGADRIRGKESGDVASDGNNVLYGGTSNDTIEGADGHDDLFGGDGDDSIIGWGGRDVLKGGDGNDTLFSIYTYSQASDVIGSLICGDEDNDLLMATGPGHQCLDAGPGQPTSGSASDCQYQNYPYDTDDHDVGTTRRCYLAENLAPPYSTLLQNGAGCGCD